jgi:beta-lactamase superfamily II metal-dependent hydrolase
MGIFHFLNVRDGDCSIIQHPSGHTTVVDVCNASVETATERIVKEALARVLVDKSKTRGNYAQKKSPVNPIDYLHGLGVTGIFRFILTHPDMDHMDGIEALFEQFAPVNFWDTDNAKEIEFGEGSPYREEDWLFYKDLRDGKSRTSPKRLALYSGAHGHFYNQDENGKGGGDGLHVLAPTKELVDIAKREDDYNDASYVLLYRSKTGRILLAGDSHDRTWDHVLDVHGEDVEDVDVLVAPHHGRKSGRSYDFLNVVRPRLTVFGNARSKHLAYGAWTSRELSYVTNNQTNCVVVDTNGSAMRVFVTNRVFARDVNPDTFFDENLGAFHLVDL